MLIIVLVVAIALTVRVTANMPQYIVVTRQNESNNAFIETYDGQTGLLKVSSPVSPSVFHWPYAQMTSNTANNQVFTLLIPDDSNAVIYQFQSSVYSLKPFANWTVSDDLIIFDLQSSSKKDTLFGIKVTGKYQRTLSNIDLRSDGRILVTELYNLPENWFVNASSYNFNHDIYYALVDYFPGLSGYTREQKILTSDFSSVTPDLSDQKPIVTLKTITNINPQTNVSEYLGQLQFIAWHPEMSALFGAGINLETNTAYIVIVDPVTGLTSSPVISFHNVTEIGPLVTHTNYGTTGMAMNLFLKKAPDTWELHYLEYNTNAKYVNVDITVRTFKGPQYKYFVAGVRAYDEN